MTIFSKIINSELPAFKIAENEQFFAFLDINPLVMGHTLVIPKQEIDQFFDMPEDLLSEILVFAKPIAKAIEKAFPCNRCAISVVGIEVPHAHMHMVPLNTADDLNFTRKKLSPTQDELKDAQENILKYLNQD